MIGELLSKIPHLTRPSSVNPPNQLRECGERGGSAMAFIVAPPFRAGSPPAIYEMLPEEPRRPVDPTKNKRSHRSGSVAVNSLSKRVMFDDF